MMCRRYEDEQTGLEQAIKELTAQRMESDKDRGNAEQFSKLIKGYAGIEELSAALLNWTIVNIVDTFLWKNISKNSNLVLFPV